MYQDCNVESSLKIPAEARFELISRFKSHVWEVSLFFTSY